jgi:glutathione peroxidase-family protein
MLVMSLSPLTWVVVAGAGIGVLAALRWEFADFVLDRIGRVVDLIRG